VREALRPLASLRPVAHRLERHVGIVREVARILETGRLRLPTNGGGGDAATIPAAKSEPPEAPPPAPPRPPAAQVKRVLRRYLHRLAAQAPRRGRGAPTGHFVDHLGKLATSYWPGLFHTYDHPEIPATTNALEGLFGSSKRALRATTGRASTAGGKMQSCGEVALAAQCLTRTLAKVELDRHLNAVSDTAFAASKQRLRRLAEPARERRSIQRDLGAYLDRTLAAWLGENPARGP
jgi:hypothetical protein